ncbi:MAG: hypothetical protein A4E62_01236 [Syntrophorhabdus sp. PtaU1.Bin002]|nr:MAG: hypothetical protein A4E62_01236 [Syntrophorhabdus sp. PtaU1.Bin002]
MNHSDSKHLEVQKVLEECKRVLDHKGGIFGLSDHKLEFLEKVKFEKIEPLMLVSFPDLGRKFEGPLDLPVVIGGIIDNVVHLFKTPEGFCKQSISAISQ